MRPEFYREGGMEHPRRNRQSKRKPTMLTKFWPWSEINKHKQHAQAMSWLVRASFERGHRSMGDDWRKDWKETPERATLVRMGYIKEDDAYR